MIKKIAGVDLKHQFPYSSQGIKRELFLTLAQVFKEKIKEKIGNAVYGILTDEVTDISLMQQLVTFIQYDDSQSCTTTTSFLTISNTLKGNNSADAPQIKKVLLEQLQSVGLEVQTMRSFVSDSASVMTGARNGVAKLLKDENPLILSFHCLAHNLALACASSADTLDYIAHCELQLNSLKIRTMAVSHTFRSSCLVLTLLLFMIFNTQNDLKDGPITASSVFHSYKMYLKTFPSRGIEHNRVSHIKPLPPYWKAQLGIELTRVVLSSAMLALLAGDINLNPGPTKDLCRLCLKGCRKNQKAIQCEDCEGWYHAITLTCLKQSIFISHQISIQIGVAILVCFQE